MNQLTDKRPTRQIILGAIVLLLLGGIIAWSLKIGPGYYWSLGGESQTSLATNGDYGTVPDFSLTERSERAITRQDLHGQIWIVNFIFTTCKETCPAQSAAMSRLQDDMDLKGRIKLVSITVDPERDTPEVLTEYANRFGAHPKQWYFLTGTKEEIYGLAQEGFRLGAAQVSKSSDSPAYIHSSRLVLVDGEAKIRGYYESADPKALHKLTQDIKLMLKREKAYG